MSSAKEGSSSSLTSNALLDCISRVCRDESRAEQGQPPWTFAPADATTLRRAHCKAAAGKSTPLDDDCDDTFDTNLLLGVVGQQEVAQDNEWQWLCTFYLAYSTWEGE